MILLARLTAAAAALAFMAPPALAQTDGTAPPASPAAPMQEQGVQPPLGAGGQNPDQIREMMREMMQEMMRGEPRARGERAKRRGADRRRHDGMGRPGMMDHHGVMRGPGGAMRSGMMHGAGMRLMFAIVDADGDGALSLAEVQDFHGRIFDALDEDGDGGVDMEEIQSFFHGDGEETDR